jgi:hypothetical protein
MTSALTLTGSRTAASAQTCHSSSSTLSSRSGRRLRSTSFRSALANSRVLHSATTLTFPQETTSGLIQPRTSISTALGLSSLVAFFSTIVNTARSWVDQGLVGMPGYRDRIVTVYHDDDEGGMNLNMPRDHVTALAEREESAGTLLVEKHSSSRNTPRREVWMSQPGPCGLPGLGQPSLAALPHRRGRLF